MGAYAYCRNRECGNGMDRPGVTDIADDNWCCHSCGQRHELPREPMVLLCEIVSDLQERIETLESVAPPSDEGDLF